MTQTYDITEDFEEETEDPFGLLEEEAEEPRQDDINELRAKLMDAEERADANYRALEDFKKRVVQEGLRQAERHDWCSTYDEIMASLGLPGRPRTHTVSVRVHYTAQVAVLAIDWDEAVEKVNEATVQSHWSPPSPLVGFPTGYAMDVEYEVED